jgi:hypothetical protein
VADEKQFGLAARIMEMKFETMERGITMTSAREKDC